MSKAKPASKSPKAKPAAKPAAKGGKTVPAKTAKPASKKPAAAKAAPQKAPKASAPKSKAPAPKSGGQEKAAAAPKPAKTNGSASASFIKKQKERLLALRDSMLDAMTGVARDTLRSRADGNEASAFGMHQADAGSDAYDRDFALSLLSQEQDALYEIDEALKRIELGTYGVCEMSGKPIPAARLEAIPFARFTVECQSQIEKQRKQTRSRVPVTSLFGLTDEESAESEEDDTLSEAKE